MKAFMSRPQAETALLGLLRAGEIESKASADLLGIAPEMAQRILIDWLDAGFICRRKKDMSKRGGRCFIYFASERLGEIKITDTGMAQMTSWERELYELKRAGRISPNIDANSFTYRELNNKFPLPVASFVARACAMLGPASVVVSRSNKSSELTTAALYTIYTCVHGTAWESAEKLREHHEGLYCLLMVKGEIHAEIRL